MTKFHFLGRVSDMTGVMSGQIQIPEDVTDSIRLRRWIGQLYDSLEGFQDDSIRIAIDGEVATEPCLIGSPNEIAFLPPVGGG